MPPPKNRELTLLVTVGILAAFAGVDYAAPFVGHDNNGWLVALAFGACIAQVTLIAAWAVLAPGNIVVRLPWSLLLGLTMWYVLAFGEKRAAGTRFEPRNILILGLALLLGVTVLQVPLWIAKQAFRYRMLVPGEGAEAGEKRPLQFQLKHLLIGTFLLSVALSPIRLVLPKENIGGLVPHPELIALIPAVIVVDLVATLPCLWGGFVSEGRVWWLGLAWTVYCLVVSGIELAVLCAILGRPREDAIWQLGLLNFTQGTVVFAVMRIYRTLGYRLQRVPRAEQVVA